MIKRYCLLNEYLWKISFLIDNHLISNVEKLSAFKIIGFYNKFLSKNFHNNIL